jgi:fatty-acyl-CoA synthase
LARDRLLLQASPHPHGSPSGGLHGRYVIERQEFRQQCPSSPVTVPIGAQGELCFRGFSVMRGYWGDAARTRETIDEAGWLHSGDLGVIDVDGFIRITGRSKDMVIRGGENIYPREVEESLFKHPAVADAQGFGVPDAHWGEELCVWIRLKDGATATKEEIRAFCSGKIMHFKVPRYVRFVNEYPMTLWVLFERILPDDPMGRRLAHES